MVIEAPDILRDVDFRRISAAVYQHCGINLHEGKRELVSSRLARRMRDNGMSSYSQYIDFALADIKAPEFGKMIDSITTNLTSFFRENQHFEYLTNKFLPTVLEQKRKKGELRLRAWSAGCSTGEEPYSIAITLIQSIPTIEKWDVKLLATDLSTNVLKRASSGEYAADRLEGITPQQRSEYFTRSNPRDAEAPFVVAPHVRRLISFRYLNLMEKWPFSGPFDFIFCRNVMIYFDKPTQERLVNRYYDCLAPKGVLFTGHSESLTGINHRFDNVQPTIYRKG